MDEHDTPQVKDTAYEIVLSVKNAPADVVSVTYEPFHGSFMDQHGTLKTYQGGPGPDFRTAPGVFDSYGTIAINGIFKRHVREEEKISLGQLDAALESDHVILEELPNDRIV